MLQLPPERFRAQLLELLEAGFRFMTVAELALLSDGESRRRDRRGQLRRRHAYNVTTALPIRRELGIRATVYVPTGWLGGRSPWIGPAATGRS